MADTTPRRAGAGRTVELRAAAADRPALEIVRSARRRRTGTAFPRDGRVVVQLPAGLSQEDEDRLIARLVGRVTGAARARGAGGDEALAARARQLADQYLDGVRPVSVTWSSRQQRRYGSCTPAAGTIRISDRAAAFPSYVRDYLLVHELAHLVEEGHGPAFEALVSRYPDRDRARGFLDGLEFAAGQPPTHPNPPV